MHVKSSGVRRFKIYFRSRRCHSNDLNLIYDYAKLGYPASHWPRTFKLFGGVWTLVHLYGTLRGAYLYAAILPLAIHETAHRYWLLFPACCRDDGALYWHGARTPELYRLYTL